MDPLVDGLEGDQLIQIPLGHGLSVDHVAVRLLADPGVDVLGGGGAPLVLGADPTLTRHQGGNGGRVGEQHTGAVRQLDLGLVAADLLNEHWGFV